MATQPAMDDVIINKAATIERCVARAREEYAYDPTTFSTNYSRQDAAILNILRACEAALDLGYVDAATFDRVVDPRLMLGPDH